MIKKYINEIIIRKKNMRVEPIGSIKIKISDKKIIIKLSVINTKSGRHAEDANLLISCTKFWSSIDESLFT